MFFLFYAILYVRIQKAQVQVQMCFMFYVNHMQQQKVQHTGMPQEQAQVCHTLYQNTEGTGTGTHMHVARTGTGTETEPMIIMW